MKIEGRLVGDNRETQYGKWSVEDIQAFLTKGCHISLHVSAYYIDDTTKEEHYARANMLTLVPNRETIFMKDEHLCVTTAFIEPFLPFSYRTGHDENLVPVTCLIDPNDKELFVTIVNEEKSAS